LIVQKQHVQMLVVFAVDFFKQAVHGCNSDFAYRVTRATKSWSDSNGNDGAFVFLAVNMEIHFVAIIKL
jgi:hypothetical protein